jgi:hypothetical protein
VAKSANRVSQHTITIKDRDGETVFNGHLADIVVTIKDNVDTYRHYRLEETEEGSIQIASHPNSLVIYPRVANVAEIGMRSR